MAHYSEVDCCSEEVRTVANPGFGGTQYTVKKEMFEEVDDVSRAGRGHHHGHHGHHGHGDRFEARESRFEEDVNTCTGQFHERKESFAVKST